MQHTIKNLSIVLILLIITACAAPVNSVSFGKKCHVVTDATHPSSENMTSSYVWFYDSKTGLPATGDQCPPRVTKK